MSTTTYTFTPSTGSCANSVNVTVSVLPGVFIEGIFHD
jgi:hypothetical protein